MNTMKYKNNCCFRYFLFIHIVCLWMPVLFYFSCVCQHVGA